MLLSFRVPFNKCIAVLTCAMVSWLANTRIADAQATAVPLSNAFSSATSFGTSPGNLLSDPFAYDPNLPYFDPQAVASLPATGFLPSNAFVTEPPADPRFWGADVTLSGAETLDFVDIWGRTGAAPGENERHQGLTFRFFSGTGGTGALLGTSSPFDGVTDQNGAELGSAYGRFDVSSVLNDTQRGMIGSFTITHALFPPPNELFVLQEVRAGFGEPVFPVPFATVNRDTGNITINNGPVARTLQAYTVDSASGALNSSAWDSLANGANNGTLDSDPWIELSGELTNGIGLAESELPGGDGGYSLGASAAIDIGAVWGKNSNEDVEVTLVNSDGSTTPIAVTYEGNNGAPFLLGDLDFNNAINLLDWGIFRAGFGGAFPNLSGSETYAMGDLDNDLDVDVDDFRLFETAYDAANPGASLDSAIASVPEPNSALLVAVGCLLGAARRRRVRSAVIAIATASFLPMLILSSVEAQTFSVIPAPLDPPNDVVGSSSDDPSRMAHQMFDSPVTAADIDVTDYTGVAGDDEFAGSGQGPHQVYIDNNNTVTTNWIAYAQRGATVDWIGEIEVWFSDTDFGGQLPATEPDATAIIDRRVGGLLQSFQLSDTVSGRFAALNMIRAPEGTINPGGREFRFLQGPDAFTLEVNTSTGDMTIRNTNPLAQSLDINAYDIASSAGSLSVGGWDGLAGQAGFPAATSQNAGDGWEQGGSSGASLLAEAYLLGGSNVSLGSELSIGDGYNTTVDARDLAFTYSLENGVKMLGVVEYISPPGTVGDYNNDGMVNVADYTLWRDNLGGDSSVLANNNIAGTVTSAHYIQWQSNFGNTPGTGALADGTSPVPEPAAWGMLLLCVCMVGVARAAQVRACSSGHFAIAVQKDETSMETPNIVRAALLVCFASFVLLSSAESRASTPDRIYLLGDNSALATENGSSNLGQVIGSQAGTSVATVPPTVADGFTLDHAAFETDVNTFTVLTPTGDPRYVDVGPGGLNRPGTTGTSVGADLDGGDYLSTPAGFGNPVDGGLDYSGTINYQGLINHYMQGWVRPTSPGSPGTRQTIIRDTDQFRIHIQADAQGNSFWGQHYAVTTQTTEVEVDFNEWSHVAQYSDGDNGFFWINGVIAGTIGGFFQPNGFSVEGNTVGAKSLSLGADVTGASATPSNFFTGQLDDFDIRVSGDNTGQQPNGCACDGFNLEQDNAFIAQLVADGTLVPGDVNGDMVVNGDGTGDPASDDVAFFVEHYFDQQVINFVVAGDLNSRMQIADLNYSGTTNIFDWLILVENHEDSALASSLDLGALLSGNSNVPEPGSLAMAFAVLSTAGIYSIVNRRKHQIG